MKKLLMMMLIATTMFVTNTMAQSHPSNLSPYTYVKTGDSLLNADTVFITLTKHGNDLVSIQPVVTKVSGTVAGTAYIQASNDDVNWVNITTIGDSLTLTNTSVNTKFWTFDKNYYNSIRVVFITTGTQKSIPSLVYTRREEWH